MTSVSVRRVLTKALIGWAVVLVLCALVEGGFRLFVDAPEDAPLWIPTPEPGGPDVWRRSPLHVHDLDTFWRARPNVDEIYTGVRVRTNEFGLRGPPIAREKQPGVFRVLCLGESSTFGSKIEQDAIYTAVLERCLDERRDGTTYEVLNAGTPGYSVVQSYAYLRRYGLDFDPDVVVLYHGYNDFLSRSFVRQRVSDPGDEEAAELTDLALLEQRDHWLARVKAWLIDHSRILQCATGARSPAPPQSAPVVETLAVGDNPLARVPEEDRSATLAAILELTRSRGIELVILVPSYESFDAHRAVLVSFARANHVACIDVEEVIRAHGKERSRYFADKVHPSPVLHRLIAAALCAQIDR